MFFIDLMKIDMFTLPSLIVGGSITKFSIFFRPLQYISTPQFTEILEISTPPPIYCQPPKIN